MRRPPPRSLPSPEAMRVLDWLSIAFAGGFLFGFVVGFLGSPR